MMFKPIDLERLKTYTLAERKHLVSDATLVKPTDPPAGLADGFPPILGAANIEAVAREAARACCEGKVVVLAMGAHVIKCGLSLLVIDLMERGVISAVVLNGAGAVHDFELAAVGGTSEDVQAGLDDGSFGMAEETAAALNGAARRAAERNEGFGASLGASFLAQKLPNAGASILAAGARLHIPVTVHVALGCDIVHMHPNADGGAIGAATLADFRTLTGIVAELDHGVWLNAGSAVMLPEVFLKALTVARNVTGGPRRFMTADFDMIRHYRPQKNVVERPGGRGVSVTGHHEITIPLFRWGVLDEMGRNIPGVRS